MAVTTKLYRLLRDDENPLEDGITAERPMDDDHPIAHICYGSRQCSQWISTSKELSAIDVLTGYKRRTEGQDRICRVVEIDEESLKLHANNMEKIASVIEIVRKYPGLPNREQALLNNLLEKITGRILDFNEKTVLDTHIPASSFSFENLKARGYAKRYKEVLVERFIPAKCCIAIHNR